MPQPRNVEVGHCGRVICGMIVRRRTIYPGTRCQREY